jgi:GT2 family glycosyltransferase
VGIVHYRAYADLGPCLASVNAQTLAPASVVVVDADADPAEIERLRSGHPDVRFDPQPNRGYAGGANRVLEVLQDRDAELDFILIMNPDVVLDSSFAEQVISEMSVRPRVALASGKLMRPDGIEIDSAGIRLPLNRRPRDRGSEELDRGQFDVTERVFASSGAVLMIRVVALPDLEIDGEVFDEDFFMYHEDTDLGWRAAELGWHSLYVHDARAVHKRNWKAKGRFDISPEIRRHSFTNHYLQMIKNERAWRFVRDLPVILGWELARLGFALIKDRPMLSGYGNAWRLSGNAWRKRRLIRERADQLRRSEAPGES